MRLRIGTRLSLQVSGFAEASASYSAARDRSGEGGSTFPSGTIHDQAGTVIARVSYNGRVWGPEPWKVGDVPLWDNRQPVEEDFPALPFGSTWRANLYGIASGEANVIALRDGRIMDCTDAGENLDWSKDGRATDIIFWTRVREPGELVERS